MKTLLRPAISLFLLLSVITGIAYPVAVTGISKAIFPGAAGGSLIVKDGKPVGSELIGQNFADPKYFWGRPSATSPQPNNGTASGGSNLGPLNPALVDAVKGRVDALKFWPIPTISCRFPPIWSRLPPAAGTRTSVRQRPRTRSSASPVSASSKPRRWRP